MNLLYSDPNFSWWWYIDYFLKNHRDELSVRECAIYDALSFGYIELNNKVELTTDWDCIVHLASETIYNSTAAAESHQVYYKVIEDNIVITEGSFLMRAKNCATLDFIYRKILGDVYFCDKSILLETDEDDFLFYNGELDLDYFPGARDIINDSLSVMRSEICVLSLPGCRDVYSDELKGLRKNL